MDPHLCLVLTAELLFGNGLKDKSKPSLCIQKYETKLFEYFKEHKSDIEGVQKQGSAIISYYLFFLPIFTVGITITEIESGKIRVSLS